MEPTQPPWSTWQRWVNRHKLMERLHNQFGRTLPLHDTWNAPHQVIYVPNHIRYEHIPTYEQGNRKHMWNFIFPPTLPPTWLKALQNEISLSELQGTPPTPPSRVRAPVSTNQQWRDAAIASVLTIGVMLFVLLLVVRLVNKYYDLHLFKVFGSRRAERRQRAEWTRPTSLAALEQPVPTIIDTITPITRDDYEVATATDALNIDLPPPYSECVTMPTTTASQDDLPPPYSSCSVTFIRQGEIVNVDFPKGTDIYYTNRDDPDQCPRLAILARNLNPNFNHLRRNDQQNEAASLVSMHRKGVVIDEETDSETSERNDDEPRSAEERNNDENKSLATENVVV